MAPRAEARGQAGAVDRRPEQPFAQRPALAVVEVAAAVPGRVAVGLDDAPAGRQADEVELALAGELAGLVELPPVDGLQPVAGLQVALEVDVPAQQLDHLRQGRRRQPGASARRRRSCRSIGAATATVRERSVRADAARGKAAVLAPAPDGFRSRRPAAARVAPACASGAAAGVEREAQPLSDLQAAQVGDLAQAADRRVRLRSRRSRPLQDVEQRVATPQLDLGRAGGGTLTVDAAVGDGGGGAAS